MPANLQELESELRKDPKLRRFYELAREYQKQGRLDEAAVWCEKGLALNPSQWQARILLAQVYVAKGRLLEARTHVERVLLPLPDNVPANHLAADIYLSMGDHEKALRHYQVVELFEPGRAGVGEKIRELAAPAEAEPPPQPVAAPEPEPVPEPLEEEAEAAPPPPRLEAAPAQYEEEQVETAEVTPPDAELLELVPEEEEAVPTLLSLDEVQEVPAEQPEPLQELQREPEEVWEAATDTFEQEILQVQESVSEGEPDGVDAAELDQGPAPGPVVLPAEQQAAELQETAEAEELFAVEAPQSVEDSSPAFSTVTLAELYENQGYPEKAVEVYQRILLKDPESSGVREKVSQLLMRMAGEAPEGPAVRPEDIQKAMRQKRVMHLKNWLRRMREARHV
jgi:tetratricopeptide (TPR) repeat protein